MEDGNYGRLIYLALLLLALAGWALVEFRQRLGQALRASLAWGLIFAGLAAGYGLWADLKTDLLPRQLVTAAGVVEIPRAEDGHYYAETQIDGLRVTFMADTGASTIVLSRTDARRLGIDTDALVFTGEAMTANGAVRTALVRLGHLRLGPFTDTDVVAYVNDGDMDISLLGMDYLGRFRIEIAGEKMRLSR